MIVLKILLYILLAVLGIILIVLIIPVGGELSYIDGKLSYKVKLWVLDVMDSDGGGLLGWLKKRRAAKKAKPKPVKAKKTPKKKERDKYEWENELDSIPVNEPETDAQQSETVAETAESTADTVHEEVTEETPEKKKHKKKKKKSDDDTFSEDDDVSWDDEETDTETETEKKSLTDKIEFLVSIWEAAQRPLLKIFKGFKLKDLYIDFVIADEDAYSCALKYGRYSTLVYNLTAFFSQLFTVRLKTVDIRPQFGVSKGRWDVSGKLYFRLGTVVIAGMWFLITYIFKIFIPQKLRNHKMKKTAARQK